MELQENEIKRLSNLLDKIPNIRFESILNGKKINIDIIDKDSSYWSDHEYNIRKQINVRDENDFLILNFQYRNCYSQNSNGGCFEVYEHFFLPPDKNYPEGYQLEYSNWNAYILRYSINEVEYYISLGNGYIPTIIKTSNQKEKYFIKNNILYKELNNMYLGIDIDKGTIKIAESIYPYYKEITNANNKIFEKSNIKAILTDIKEIVKVFKDIKDVIVNFPHKEIVEKVMNIITDKIKNDKLENYTMKYPESSFPSKTHIIDSEEIREFISKTHKKSIFNLINKLYINKKEKDKINSKEKYKRRKL